MVRTGRYCLGVRLGSGAMGVVFRAHDPALQRDVAVKRLFPDDAADPAARRRFLHEARAMAQVEHAHVVKIFDVGADSDDVFLAMELLPGPTLREWMVGPRSWREVVRHFVAAARGLSALHVAGVVHRDFKPDNVMLGADGAVRVMDLGLAEATSYREDDPSWMPAGSFGYTAPELFTGRDADERSDQFAFFVALHEALTGQRPFRAATPWAHFVAITDGPSPAMPSGIPSRLAAILARGLSADPEDRLSTMSDVADALQRCVAARAGRRGLVAAVLALVAFGIFGPSLTASNPACPPPSLDWIAPAVADAQTNLAGSPAIREYTLLQIERSLAEIEGGDPQVCGIASVQPSCRQRSESQLRGALAALASVDAANVDAAWAIADGMATPCDSAGAATDVRQDELAAVHAMLAEAKTERRASAIRFVVDAVARADAQDIPRVAIVARLAAGRTYHEIGENDRASAAFREAAWLVYMERIPAMTADAALELAGVMPNDDVRLHEARTWLDHAITRLEANPRGSYRSRT